MADLPGTVRTSGSVRPWRFDAQGQPECLASGKDAPAKVWTTLKHGAIYSLIDDQHVLGRSVDGTATSRRKPVQAVAAHVRRTRSYMMCLGPASHLWMEWPVRMSTNSFCTHEDTPSETRPNSFLPRADTV